MILWSDLRTSRYSNGITPSAQQCRLPASAQQPLPHPSPGLPATRVAQPPWRSRAALLRTLCVPQGMQKSDCDAERACLGRRHSSSGTRLRRGKGTETGRGRGTLGRAKRGWIGGSGIRAVGKSGRCWVGSRCGVGRRSWILSLMTPTRRTRERVWVRMRGTLGKRCRTCMVCWSLCACIVLVCTL